MFIDSKSPKRAVTRLLISALCHSPFSISIKSPIFSVKYRLAVAMHLSKSAADGNVNFSVSSPLISSVDCRVGDYVDFQFFRIVGVSEFYDFHLFPLILLYITARWA